MNGFEQGNGNSSAVEKMVNNVWTILLSRLAMILALPFAYLAMSWIEVKFVEMRKDQAAIQVQVDELRRSERAAATTLQDHESRLVFGKGQREAFQARAEVQFGNIANSLLEIGKTLHAIDITLEGLKSTMKEREDKERTPR